MLRFMTAGESHGKALLAVIEGLPAGLKLEEEKIDLELKRRMAGYGRGGRMDIESDTVEILSGVKNSETLASPVALKVSNFDYKIETLPPVFSPRPGHADLAGLEKYGFKDARCVLERASARETAARVAVGAVAKIFLREFGIRFTSHLTGLGGIRADKKDLSFDDILLKSEESELRCVDASVEKDMKNLIDRTKAKGDTLGGSFEVLIDGLVPGLGSYVHWDRRLDGAFAKAVMSIPAVKAVSIGSGIKNAFLPGSKVHDQISYDEREKLFKRDTNRAGGLEGGVTNGGMLSISGFMKPIATLKNALSTIRINDKSQTKASTERSDVTAVPACSVVAEAVCAIELAGAFLEKFGSDSLSDIRKSYDLYVERLKEI